MELLKLLSTLKGEGLGFCKGVEVTNFFLLVDANTIHDKALLRKLADIVNVRVYNLSGFGAQVTLTRLAPEGKAIVLLPSETLEKMRKASSNAPSTVITIRDTEFLVVFDYNAEIKTERTEGQGEAAEAAKAAELVRQDKRAKARVSIDSLAETIANKAGFKAANDLLAEYKRQHLEEVEDTKPKKKASAQQKTSEKKTAASVPADVKSQEEDLEERLEFLQDAKNDNNGSQGADASSAHHVSDNGQQSDTVASNDTDDSYEHIQREESNGLNLEEVEREILSQSLATQTSKASVQQEEPKLTKEQMAELKEQLKEERAREVATAKKALEQRKKTVKQSTKKAKEAPKTEGVGSEEEPIADHAANVESSSVAVTLEGPEGLEVINVTEAFNDRLAKWKDSYPAAPIVVMEPATMEAMRRQEYDKIQISYNEDMDFIKVGDKL